MSPFFFFSILHYFFFCFGFLLNAVKKALGDLIAEKVESFKERRDKRFLSSYIDQWKVEIFDVALSQVGNEIADYFYNFPPRRHLSC